jgi:hypothetical protein
MNKDKYKQTVGYASASTKKTFCTMSSDKYRKCYVSLDQKNFEICSRMAKEGKSSKDIARFSGQSIRNAQRFIQRTLASNIDSHITVPKLERRGPKPLHLDILQGYVRKILTADNSLTIKGNAQNY